MIPQTQNSPCLSDADNNSKDAECVYHGEFIVIGGDENAKDQNSSDREEDVGAGAGTRDELVNL